MNQKKHTAVVSRTGWLSQLALITLLATGCGGGSGGGSGNTDVDQPPPTPGISLLAGSIGGPGNLDGVGTAARFRRLGAIASDSAGNAYVVDDRKLRRVTPSGVVSTLIDGPQGWASLDGLTQQARAMRVVGIAGDALGNMYLTTPNAVQKLTPSGGMTILAGTEGSWGLVDGQGLNARFTGPGAITVDATGTLYVMDGRILRRITPTGLVTTIAGDSSAPFYDPVARDGQGAYARFTHSPSVAVDRSGNIYVLDAIDANSLDSGYVIRKVTPAGLVTTLPDTVARSLAGDAAGNVYVAEGTHLTWTLRDITPTGATTTSDRTGSMSLPTGVAFAPAGDGSGNFYVSPALDLRVIKVSPAGVVTTLAGQNAVVGSADGEGALATFGDQRAQSSCACWELGTSNDLTVDSANNVYVADGENATIRKVTPTGFVSTFAGTAGRHGATDGVNSTATFLRPIGLSADALGNLYVIDDNNTLRRITPTGIVTTVAGAAGMPGSVDGTGGTARFGHLGGVTVDATGNTYVTETTRIVSHDLLFMPQFESRYAHTVRKITPSGAVTTLAGTTGQPGSADGMGASAKFNFDVIAGVAVDAGGNVYVADSGNHTIRKISPEGMVTTLAGSAGVSGSSDGTGTATSFKYPRRLTIDTHGNLYVTTDDNDWSRGGDKPNSTIRRITPTGVVTTVAGKPWLEGIDLGPLPGSLARPGGIAVDAKGTLYVISQAAVLKVQLPQ